MAIQIKTRHESRLEKLRTFEHRPGVGIAGYHWPPRLASLTEKQLEQLQDAEKELGSILIAYQCR